MSNKTCSNCSRFVHGKQCPLNNICATFKPELKSSLNDFYAPNDEIKAKIKEELSKLDISDMQTDSDLLDFAQIHNFTPFDVEYCLAEIKVKGTSCENCAYMINRLSYGVQYPCSSCSRIKQDYYVDEKDALKRAIADAQLSFVKDYLRNKATLIELEDFLGYQIDDEIVETLDERIRDLFRAMDDDEKQKWYKRFLQKGTL